MSDPDPNAALLSTAWPPRRTPGQSARRRRGVAILVCLAGAFFALLIDSAVMNLTGLGDTADRPGPSQVPATVAGWCFFAVGLLVAVVLARRVWRTADGIMAASAEPSCVVPASNAFRTAPPVGAHRIVFRPTPESAAGGSSAADPPAGLSVPPMPAPVRGWLWVPAPGWLQPPPGWRPMPGWQPDPDWPPAPPNWHFWQPDPVEEIRRRALCRRAWLFWPTLAGAAIVPAALINVRHPLPGLFAAGVVWVLASAVAGGLFARVTSWGVFAGIVLGINLVVSVVAFQIPGNEHCDRHPEDQCSDTGNGLGTVIISGIAFPPGFLVASIPRIVVSRRRCAGGRPEAPQK
jgi:hypothetical protein